MMPDPCGPEMTVVLWALFQGILWGLLSGVAVSWLLAFCRRLLGQVWRFDPLDSPILVTVISLIVALLAVVWAIYDQFG